MSTREVRLCQRPAPGQAVSSSCFETVTVPLPEMATLKEKGIALVRVRPLFFSVDPYLRSQFDSNTGVDYVKPFGVGSALSSFAVGVVEDVFSPADSAGEKSAEFTVGAFVISDGMEGWPWREKALWFTSPAEEPMLPFSRIRVLPDALFNASNVEHALGVFGATGLTAYFGIFGETKLTRCAAAQAEQEKEAAPLVVVISAAAGGTGLIAAQLARHCAAQKCFVVGIAGGEAKCSFLTDSSKVGACDATVNYKAVLAEAEPDHTSGVKKLRAALQVATAGRSIDIFFDSVGGPIAAAAHGMMSEGGQSVLCGQISAYNSKKSEGEVYPPPLPEEERKTLETLKVKRERFLVLKYHEQFERATFDLASLVASQRVVPINTVAEGGLDQLGEAFIAVMSGKNIGKMIVKM